MNIKQYVRKRLSSETEPTYGSYYFHLIWLICISACVPILLVGTVYYYITVQHEKERFQEFNRDDVILHKDRVERVLQGIEKDSIHLVMDPTVKEKFANFSWSRDGQGQLELLQTIGNVKHANDFVREVFVYYKSHPQFFSSNVGQIILRDYPFRNQLEEWQKVIRYGKWVRTGGSEETGRLFYVIPIPINEPGILAVEVDLARFRDMLKSTTAWEANRSFLILNTQHEPIFESFTTTDALLTLADSPAAAGGPEEEVRAWMTVLPEGGKAFVHTVRSSGGRLYVSVVPDRMILNRLRWIRNDTLLGITVLCCFCLLLSLVISHKAYIPVRRLFSLGKTVGGGRIQETDNDIVFIGECLDLLQKETKHLEEYRSRTDAALKRSFLQRLVHGEYQSYAEESLTAECERFGIAWEGPYAALVIHIENLYKDQRFLHEDRPIAAFAATNVMEELLAGQTQIRGHVLQSYDGKGVALLNFTGETAGPERIRQVRQYADSVCASLKTYLKFNISAGVGRVYPDIRDMTRSYREAIAALQYRLDKDSDHLMYIGSEGTTSRWENTQYPKRDEEALIAALTDGDPAEAQRCLIAFSEVVHSIPSYKQLYQSYHLLLATILHSIEARGGAKAEWMDYDLFDQLRNCYTSKEICEWFADVMFPLYQRLMMAAGRNDKPASSPLKEVCGYIEEHVGSADVTLVLCAERAGVSASYLSRLFKRELGMSFMEYVMECRINKSKHLMLDPSLRICDIAEKVGYSERNFSRIFLRLTGMPPSQYRAFYRQVQRGPDKPDNI